jgi:hypothetical protein
MPGMVCFRHCSSKIAQVVVKWIDAFTTEDTVHLTQSFHSNAYHRLEDWLDALTWYSLSQEFILRNN